MFVDTNVLVNARILYAPDHEKARASLLRVSEGGEPLRISRQILREYLATVTRPQTWQEGISRTVALSDLENLMERASVLEDSPEVTRRLISLCREIPVGGKQIHDANIVATMLAYGERRLLTLNVSDFRRYGDRIELISS